jgi:hypothetical protein
MKQTTFADSGFEIATKKPRKRIFLAEVNAAVQIGRSACLSAQVLAPIDPLRRARRLPIDNNPWENAIRPFVIGRKNWFFSNTSPLKYF